MSDDRWQRVQGLFEQAVGIAAPERAGFLDAVCAGDDGLRAEVESLLEHDGRANRGFLRTAVGARELG
ncbi:MAG: hypothetical protein HOP29_12340, partial [Phycisphaerales bacterium]|nr:hypothetical protein [Phycisphaerales bacterium]